jgi:hypothetical protein
MTVEVSAAVKMHCSISESLRMVRSYALGGRSSSLIHAIAQSCVLQLLVLGLDTER